MDKQSELLSRLAANHLYLGQFEPLRATLIALRARNPDLARAILQTIVAKAGQFNDAVLSSSCPSPSHLTYLSLIELLQFNDASSAWGFDPDTLRLRVEFLLLVQMLVDRARGGWGDCVEVLERVLELGISLLKVVGSEGTVGYGAGMIEEDEELVCLSGMVREYADVFDALCLNVQLQKRDRQGFDSSLAITRTDDETGAGLVVEEEQNFKVMGFLQRRVQLAHLDAMKDCLENDDEEGAISHIRYLHLDCGVEEMEYRMVLEVLLKMVLLKRKNYGKLWIAIQKTLLQIYEDALSSKSGQLVEIVQVLQDKLLVEEAEMYRALGNNQMSPPIERFRRYIMDVKSNTDSEEKTASLKMAVCSCMRDLYHYARVSGQHMLELVMDAALSAVRREQLQEASYVLTLYPRLQPLVAVMGWDLLSGKTSARRELMYYLWSSKSQVYRLEESSLYGDQSDERSCVEHLCDTLCYQLDLASFVASVNSGKKWDSKCSLLLSGKEQTAYRNEVAQLDPFVENFILERLSVQSPLQVLFDAVPGIKFQDAIELISMQPIASSAAAWKRMQDIELMHMRYALVSTILAVGAIDQSVSDEGITEYRVALGHLKNLQKHLQAINDIPRKILMVNIIISILHMDSNSTHCATLGNYYESPCTYDWDDDDDLTTGECGNNLVIIFTSRLLELLRCNTPSSPVDQGHDLNGCLSTGGRQAFEWRFSMAKQFVEDWEWRLSFLQHLMPLSERQWQWKEALAVLCAAPSKLLNLCMQRAKYDIGSEAVHRFLLSAEDKATLELIEWGDKSFGRASVEESLSRAADGTYAVKDLDISTLRTQLGPLPAVLLCIDVATTAARSASMSQQLLNQAQVMLSEIYPGVTPKRGSTYWDQIREIGIISVSKRVLKCLHEFLNQDNPPVLQDILSGYIYVMSSKDNYRQGHKERALTLLHQMIEHAHMGKRQFLSGKLHNLAKAIADEEAEHNIKVEGPYADWRNLSDIDKDGVFGLGLKADRQPRLIAEENNVKLVGYDINESGKKHLGPLSSKATTYLSQFILHIAAIGDIVDGTDTTHDFNFFSVVYEWPKDLLTRLVFDRGSADAAGKLADVMGADFVHEVISACVPPVLPPRSGHGWACIPVIPTCSRSNSENKALSPNSKISKPNSYIRSSATPGVPLYPLQLDIVKHLVKLSPVRAVLACVFGSSILYNGSDSPTTSSFDSKSLPVPDADCLFYEFALDQSEWYPTLNRWIQMQTNLHRVLEFAETTKQTADDGKVKSDEQPAIKRLREHESDSESDTIANPSMPLPDHSGQAISSSTNIWQSSTKSEIAETETTVLLSFDWENEEPYEKAVERLIDEGKLIDALALSDRFLRNGASDNLLQLLIEHSEETYTASQQHHASEGCSELNNTWQYCLRLRDKKLAAQLALKYTHRWELDAALDVLTMCSCHLPPGDPLLYEVVQMRQDLLRYSHILSADDHYNSWLEVEAECKMDPEGLALRLAGKGAVSAALEVAESAGLSIDLRRELQGRQLVKLLTADPLSGGGPAEASRFLSSLRDSNDALPVAMGAMHLLPDLRSKKLLVHFFLKRRDGNLSDAEVSQLNSWALGLRVLAALPWQQKCSSLHEHPHLILEVLLMRKQLQSAALILKEFPSLRDNKLIVGYAAKAIIINISSPSRQTRISVTGPKPRQKAKVSTPTRLSLSLSNLQKEARRAFSWTSRNTVEKVAPKDVQRKRKSSGLAVPERVALEAMTGIQEDRVFSYSPDGLERVPPVSMAEEWMLTGDPSRDEAVRVAHRYDSAPDITLFKALLGLCSDELVSAKSALDLCVNQMKNVLSVQQLPENASLETIGRAYHATEAFVQGLLYAKSLLRKLVGVSELANIPERNRDADDASSDAGSSSVGSQSTDELSDYLSHADSWLGRAEVLQSLLGSGIAVSLDDIADKESSARLRDRLILDERYSMAVYTCKKCKVDVFPVWNAWGHALLRMEHYAQARVKFKQALQLYKDDPIPVIQEIINTIEGGPPVDVSIIRSMYEHLAKSAPTIVDDSLSADSYLNVLHMPSTFPRSERSRLFNEFRNNNASGGFEFDEEPRSNLDSVRYTECVNYLQDYGRKILLNFMFRHGHYRDACLLFFPPNAVPPPPQPSVMGVVTPSSSPQRPDPLATDYGTIDELCDLCVGYNAIPVLEEVISSRTSSESPHDSAVIQHTTAALSRICHYCESHKHFNFLYKFQVIKKDHVAAGLCCIQLFINSLSQEEALKHLEHAKLHFEEALAARHRGGDSTKLLKKSLKGKSASEKLSEEALVKFSSRLAIQMNIVRSFNDSEGSQWKHSLFGNPNDPETFRRRCEIAETLVERNFDLAFQVICEFELPAVHIYAGVAASLAERKKGSQLTEFFKNIKGFIDSDDWDQVLGAAINVYANKHKERPDRLIDMLNSSHRKVLACVVCGRLKSAFQIASKSGSVADVQHVAHQAIQANALPVIDACKQWLAQNM